MSGAARRVTTRLAGKALACLPAVLLGAPAFAFTVEHSDTRYVDRQYQCELVMYLDAPAQRIEAVLRDYGAYPTLDPRILETKVIERPQQNVVLLETVVRACFGPFCRNVQRLERVEEKPFQLVATADAQRSDVKFGETRTTIEPMDGHTRVTYQTSITPGFWIPPIVGRRWLLRTLEDNATELFRSVESRAREQ